MASARFEGSQGLQFPAAMVLPGQVIMEQADKFSPGLSVDFVHRTEHGCPSLLCSTL